jgi:hypothetical protein
LTLQVVGARISGANVGDGSLPPAPRLWLVYGPTAHIL